MLWLQLPEVKTKKWGVAHFQQSVLAGKVWVVSRVTENLEPETRHRGGVDYMPVSQSESSYINTGTGQGIIILSAIYLPDRQGYSFSLPCQVC